MQDLGIPAKCNFGNEQRLAKRERNIIKPFRECETPYHDSQAKTTNRDAAVSEEDTAKSDESFGAENLELQSKGHFAGVPLYSRLMNYAFNALSRRAMTEFEMREKLIVRLEKINHGAVPQDGYEDIISNVIARLKELKLINDENYLSDFIRAKTTISSIGKFGIFAKLRHKGISKDLFDKCWEEANVEESSVLDKACEDFERKKGAIRGDRKQKERLMRYLAGRGFPPNLIYRKLREYGSAVDT